MDAALVATRSQVGRWLLGTFGMFLIPILIILGLALVLAGNQASACSTASSSAGGSNNTQIAFNYLTTQPQLGLKPFQAAAIVGNLIHESAHDPLDTRAENPTSHALGIAQWLGDRKTGLLTYHFQRRNWDDIYLQLDYLRAELEGTHRNALDAVQRAMDIKQATDEFERTFEVSGDYASYPQREQNAVGVLARYGSGVSAGNIPVSATCSSSGALSAPPHRVAYDGRLNWLVDLPGTSLKCDYRIIGDVEQIMQMGMRITACYAASGHEPGGEHPLGLAIDAVPADGNWAKALALAHEIGWKESCSTSGCAGQMSTAFRFVGYNGYPGHGDPAHCACGGNAHIHLSWMHAATTLGIPAPWVDVF